MKHQRLLGGHNDPPEGRKWFAVRPDIGWQESLLPVGVYTARAFVRTTVELDSESLDLLVAEQTERVGGSKLPQVVQYSSLLSAANQVASAYQHLRDFGIISPTEPEIPVPIFVK